LLKILVVRSNSDEMTGAVTVPSAASAVKNAVRSATRAACCMLWVTMTIV
jgi:hypothetical protein